MTLRGEVTLFVCAFVFGKGDILFEISHCFVHDFNVDTHARISVLFMTLFCQLFVLCVHMYYILTDCAVIS